MRAFTESETKAQCDLKENQNFNFEFAEWLFDSITDRIMDYKYVINQQNATDEEKKLIKAITETTESILPKLWELNKTLYEHSLELEKNSLNKK